MKTKLTQPAFQQKRILEAFEDAWQRVLPDIDWRDNEPPEVKSVFMKPVCIDVSRIACQNLIHSGFDAKVEQRRGVTTLYHAYVCLFEAEVPLNDLIADGTWGQFLPENTVVSDDIPRVLWGSREKVIAEGLRYGVAQRKIGTDLWLPLADWQKRKDTY